jgi:hypothetical protein
MSNALDHEGGLHIIHSTEIMMMNPLRQLIDMHRKNLAFQTPRNIMPPSSFSPPDPMDVFS